MEGPAAELDEHGLGSLPAAQRSKEEEVERILSLPDASMLRAVRLSRMLRCGGQLLASSKGSEATFRLSEPVVRIDAFVSHNWATPRWLKFLALALHFNGASATLAAVGCLCLCTALTLTGLGPMVDGDSPIGLLALPCTLPTFFLVLLFQGELGLLLGCGGSMVFLDKVCIDQRSDAAKERGIRSLAAFLGKSSSMVACCSELYLQRLWTVYELATYIQVRSGEADRRVHLLPTGLSACMAACSVLFFLALLLARLVQRLRPGHSVPTSALLMVVACLGLTRVLRVWARQQGQAHEALANFSIKKAHCAREEDRALVMANSIALLKSYGFTTQDASEEEALAAFDRLVQRTILETFTASLGRTGYPFRLLLPGIVAYLSGVADIVAGTERARALRPRPELPSAPVLVATGLASAFGTLPLVAGVMLLLSRRRLHLRGWRELAYCCGVVASAAVVILGDPWRGAVSLLVPLARTSCVARAGIFTWCAALLLAAAWLFRPTALPKWSAAAAVRWPRKPVLEVVPSKPISEVPAELQRPPQRDLESLFAAGRAGMLVTL